MVVSGAVLGGMLMLLVSSKVLITLTEIIMSLATTGVEWILVKKPSHPRSRH